MRRQLAVRLAALTVVLAAGVVSARAQTFTVGDIEYHVTGPNYDEVEVSDYLGSGGHVTIPVSVFNYELYRSYKVTGIGVGAFSDCTGLISIDLPDGLTSIGQDAFYGCTGLTSIDIPDGVTSIKWLTFSGCTGLASIDLPDGLTSIEKYAFSGCTGLTSIDIPGGVTSIGDYAFQYCSSLISIDIPGGVTSIGDYAFQYCSSLISIDILGGVMSIGNRAFQYCSSLTSVDFPDSLTGIGVGAFSDCTGLTSIDIPDGLTSIEAAAFYGCTSLASVDLPDGLTSIGDGAFSGCIGLASIDIPDGVTSIGGNAFGGCIGLASIDIPDGVTSIGANAFYGCTGLTSIDIPDGVEVLEYGIFAGCTGLKSIKLPDKLKEFTDFINRDDRYGAFSGCTSLTSIELPDGLENIGRYTFNGCSGLTLIEIPDSVTSIGEGAFKGCTGLTSIDIPDGVEVLEPWTFTGCSELRSVKLPESLKELKGLSIYDNGGGVFSGCRTLASIDIPDGVTSIGCRAFQDCTGLNTIALPASLTSIGDYAFYGCGNGTSMVSYVTNNCKLGRWIFERTYFDCVVFLSNSLVDGVADLLGSPSEVFAFGDEPISVKCRKLYTFLGEDEIETDGAVVKLGVSPEYVYGKLMSIDANTSQAEMALLTEGMAVDAGTYTIDEVAFSFRYDEYGIDIPEVRVKLDEPQTYTINRASQSISWEQDFTSGLLPGMTVELGAVSSSGLGVSYMSRDEGVVRIVESGGKPCAECVSEGVCYIVAMQPGDRNHDAAPAVTKRVDVTRGSGLRDASALSIGCRPSPALDVLEVSGTSSGMACAVYDLSGARVLSSRCADGATLLDVSRLAPGAYVLVVAGGDGAAAARLRFAKE